MIKSVYELGSGGDGGGKQKDVVRAYKSLT